MTSVSPIESPRVLADGGFVFDARTGRSFALNATGAAVVRMLQAGIGPAEIANSLARAYGAEPAVIGIEVEAFTRQFTGAVA